jgi:hypothetical protein
MSLGVDTLMTMLDRATFVLHPNLDRNPRSWTVTAHEGEAADGGDLLRVRHSPDLCKALAEALARAEALPPGARPAHTTAKRAAGLPRQRSAPCGGWCREGREQRRV